MNVLQNLIKYIIILFITSASFACDVCSCAASNTSSTNISTEGHYISLVYNYLNFKFRDGVHANSPYGHDHIHQFGLNGQYTIHKKLSLQLSVPFQNNIRTTENDRVNNIGIGDVSINGMFTVFKQAKHKVKAGMGVKFPTGEFNYEVASLTNTSASQLGTGSLDVNIPLEYLFVHKKFTSLVRATYFYKTENDDDFKFGNQTQVRMLTAYKIKEHKQHYYDVNIGFSYDSYLETEIRKSKILDTDGYLLNSSIGVKYESKKMIVGLNYQLPIAQNLVEGDVTFEKGLGFYSYYKF